MATVELKMPKMGEKVLIFAHGHCDKSSNYKDYNNPIKKSFRGTDFEFRSVSFKNKTHPLSCFCCCLPEKYQSNLRNFFSKTHQWQ